MQGKWLSNVAKILNCINRFLSTWINKNNNVNRKPKRREEAISKTTTWKSLAEGSDKIDM